MQIRRAALDGVQQHLVDETYYRRIVSIGATFADRLLIINRLDIQSIQINVCQLVHAAVGRVEELVDGIAEFVVLDQNGFCGQAGAELHIGDGLVVGRVGEADEQLVTSTP